MQYKASSSSGALDGSVDFEVHGGASDYVVKLTYRHRKELDVALSCAQQTADICGEPRQGRARPLKSRSAGTILADVALGEIWGWVTAVALGIGLAATAGLRAWLPLFLVGILSRLGVVELGEAFGFVSSTPALVLFGVATVAEIVADKVPAVDHALDVISTVIRPAAGALLAASALYQVKDPLIAVVIGLCVGAPVALAPHAAKSAVRAASSATTAGFANPLVSFIEDGLAIGLFIAVVVLPIVSVAVLATIVWLIVRRRRKVAPATA